MFLPYQPREAMDQSYATADVSLVSLKPGLAGVIVPSKVYNVLASGRPCVAAVEQDCEVADIIDRADCGFVVAPRRCIRPAARGSSTSTANRDRAAAMGAPGARRRAHFDRPRQVAAYDALLREVAAVLKRAFDVALSGVGC